MPLFLIIENLKLFKHLILDELLNIDNPYFEGMVGRIYPPELRFNKAAASETIAQCLDLHLSISNRMISFIQNL